MIGVIKLFQALPVVILNFLTHLICAIFTFSHFLKEISIYSIKDMFEFCKLGEGEHSRFYFIILYITQRLFLHRNPLLSINFHLISGLSLHAIVWDYLHVFVHDAGAAVEARIEKHKCFHATHGYTTRLKIFNIQRVYLLFKIFGDNDYMAVAYWKFIEY